MPVVTISLATAALSQYSTAELVPVTIKESTTRDMFSSGSPLGTVPGSEGNMTHAHTHAHSTLLFCLMYSHIFLKGVARKVFCFGAAGDTAHPSCEPTASVGRGQGSGPVPASPQCVPALLLLLASAEPGWGSRGKRVCGAHTAWWGIHLAVNHCHMKWQGHHLGNFSALLLGLLDALWQRAAEGMWFYKLVVETTPRRQRWALTIPANQANMKAKWEESDFLPNPVIHGQALEYQEEEKNC